MPASNLPTPTITPRALQSLLCGEGELALLDVREARAFVAGHLNLARLAPLSSLGLDMGFLVPRPATPVVLIDDAGADGPAMHAASLLARLGYTDLRILAGGLAAWQAAGLPSIDGYATLIKAFGGQVLARHATPAVPGGTLRSHPGTEAAVTLIDARPADEHAFLSLPGAHNHPGTELALRQWSADAKAGPWVVHCFSRTRGIIGSTTLRLLGHPDARFLEDGVMQWALEGGPVQQDSPPGADLPSAAEEELRRRARALISRWTLPLLAPAALCALRAEMTRTLYVFDLRPGATDNGAAPGVRAVAGGQLLMHFEQLVWTRGARIVLLDAPHRLRAAVTAYWLLQLNQAEVFILDGELPSSFSAETASAQALVADAGDGLSPDALAALLDADPRARVVDVGPSADFERAHLPQAHYLLPFTLDPMNDWRQAGDRIVFTSADGRAAQWTAAEARRRWPECRAGWLRGGTEAWREAGRPIDRTWDASRLLTPFEDDWGSVMRVPADRRTRSWTDYLAWERGLGARVVLDPAVRFGWFSEPP